MEFSRQACWGRLPFPPLGDLPDPGIKPGPPAAPELQANSLRLSHLGSPFTLPTHIYFGVHSQIQENPVQISGTSSWLCSFLFSALSHNLQPLQLHQISASASPTQRDFQTLLGSLLPTYFWKVPPGKKPACDRAHLICFPFMMAQRQRICLQCRRFGFDPWVEKIPWGRK